MGAFSEGHGNDVGVCVMEGMTERERMGVHAVGYAVVLVVMALLSFMWKWVQPVVQVLSTSAAALVNTVGSKGETTVSFTSYDETTAGKDT